MYFTYFLRSYLETLRVKYLKHINININLSGFVAGLPDV